MPVVLDQVSFTYAPGTPFEVTALHEINLQIADGEFVGIMGQTGCGKTTLLQLIAGLIKPSRGTVWVDGDDINGKDYNRAVLREKMSIVFQYPEYQLFETTVEKDVAFSLRHSRLSPQEIEAKVRGALEAVGFSFAEVRALSPLGLSGGEKRKVAIAGALVTNPKILILDEPVAGLDPPGREEFLALVARLNQSGTTILMVSHDADVLGNYAQRILVLNQGRLLLDGPPESVFSNIAKLKELNLEVCRPRKIASLLRARGLPFPQEIVRYEDFIAAAAKIGERGR